MDKIYFFEKILSSLKIKFNREFLTETVNEEPNSNGFFGIIAILKSYGVESVPFTADEEFILKVGLNPIIVHLENPNEIVLIHEESKDYYKIVTEGGASYKYKKEDVLKRWSRKTIQLSCSNGKERGFARNFFIEKGKITVLSSFFLILLFLNLINENNLFINVFYTLNNFIGLFVCYKLHEIAITQNQNNSKICNTSQKTSCLSVLNHKSSKLLGCVPYDKIGFVYFLVALTVPVFYNFSESGLVLFVIFGISAFFPIYSVYFQSFVVKKWCPLCLVIQFCILFNVFLFCVFQNLNDLRFSFQPMFLLLVVVLVVLVFALYENQKAENVILRNRVNAFVRNEEIFGFLEQSQPELLSIPEKMAMVNVKTNTNSKITFVTNPFCPYCIAKYNEIKRVIDYNENVVFETIYCIPADVEIISRITLKLIKIYFEIGVKEYDRAVEEWYAYGIDNVEKWESKFQLLNNNYDEESEILKMHREWCELVKVNETPSVLFNNKLISKEYAVSDFAYIG